MKRILELQKVKLRYKEPAHIDWVDGKYHALGKEFDEFEKAYDYITSLDKLPHFDIKEIASSNKDIKASYLVVYNDVTGRMFFDYGSSEVSLAEVYDEFIKTTHKKYKAKPKDFYRAYEWLRLHPAFWHITGNPESGMFYWETDDGLKDIWHTVYTAEGKVRHLLEHGSYMDNEVNVKGDQVNLPCRVSSHDFLLDTVASTYEEAIIKLAKRVYKIYRKDGSYRK